MYTKLFAHKFNLENMNCRICGLGEESTCHIMLVCPLYKALRAKYLNYMTKESKDEDHFVTYFKECNLELIKYTQIFWSASMKEREFVLGEIN